MKAKAPGSSANLGPGFDTLAVALSIYTEVEIEPAERLTISSTGAGSDLPRDENHLAAQVAREVIGHDRLAIKVNSDIPVARGLGSSAALIIATAAAVGADDPLAIAARFEGHAENAAASLMGGLVTATFVDDKPVATPLFLDPDLKFVVIIPERELKTSKARAVLPDAVSLKDAAFNLGRLGWLIAALGDASALRPEVMDDRLHQDIRGSLFPEADQLLKSLTNAGASAACWSGAGPSILGMCVGQDKTRKVQHAVESELESLGLDGEVVVFEPDMAGLQVE